MRVFADTSALFAYLDADDANHVRAQDALGARLGLDRVETHSYAVLETAAIVHRRLGEVALGALFDGLVPALTVEYVGEELHLAAVAAFRAGSPSRISLVDRTSFEYMRRRGLDTAITFDRDFAAEGFTVLPSFR